MKKCFLSAVMLFAQVALMSSANASYVVNMYGMPITCTASNGRLAAFYAHPQAANLARQSGGARADFTNYGFTIALDLNYLNTLPPLGAYFVIYHECAHVALPLGVGLGSPLQERNADCHAVRSMRAIGLINTLTDFQQALIPIINLGGVHGIDLQRINSMSQCL